jgi:hypothetical protein
MSSSKQQIIAALDAAEASYRHLVSLPLEALTRPEKTELLKRLGEIDKKMAALDRRLIGQLITQGDPAMRLSPQSPGPTPRSGALMSPVSGVPSASA